MIEEYKSGIDKRLVLMGLAWTLGLTMLNQCDHNKRVYKLEREVHEIYQQTIKYSVNPVIRNVDCDGESDLVLKLISGEDLVLYKTKNGDYVYRKDNNDNQ